MSHGRADRVFTYKRLREQGYTGPIIIVIDTDDDQGDEYRRIFGEKNVVAFDKKEYERKMDTGDISGSMKCVVFARNACFDIADRLGYDYFIEADDDYKSFNYRYTKDGMHLGSKELHRLDDVFSAMFDFLDDSGAIAVAPGQAGDFIGGCNSKLWKDGLRRKCMNLFFCKTKNRINFVGRINEDVNTYTWYGSQGILFFTVSCWMLCQTETQSNPGGMTDTYIDNGTYLKSFYSVQWMPSAVKIGVIGSAKHCKCDRIHHSVNWNNCVPCIIDEKWKKRN